MLLLYFRKRMIYRNYFDIRFKSDIFLCHSINDENNIIIKYCIFCQFFSNSYHISTFNDFFFKSDRDKNER